MDPYPYVSLMMHLIQKELTDCFKNHVAELEWHRYTCIL